ncbi:class I SAM-dependent methyltransferase [Geomonas propionica]|uniref:Class I SAM-dependent methyltransferase n=1 Tax=Geomonas propionica TaxID=2798582 RepID=A0ABS0YWU1_9BACT|nr:class I SAM-dependent methyltransferase [Geomonas propionica]MBJ6802452.1 class I SAM-dependent methyltransferase [Geomonas propionica]
MDETPKSATWTSESIRRFWNYQGLKTQVVEEYFSFQVGDALWNLLNRAHATPRQGNILDFGCGPGFLLERLLTSGANCYGFDFSDATVDKVNGKFKAEENWRGAISSTELPVAFEDNFFHFVSCIETLEHLLDETLPGTLKELYRLLKTDGIAFFTTPFNEDLSKSMVYCPFCNHEFHKVQHVRSFTHDGIVDLLGSHGFEVVYCEAIDLFALQREKKITRHNLKRASKFFTNLVLDTVAPVAAKDGRLKVPRCTAGPNLCVLARKL